MGKRLSKIVTRTGDDGTTGLADGSRVSKRSARIEAIGTIDELNAFVGFFLSAVAADSALHTPFRRIQNDLFDLGGELSMPGHALISAEHVDRIEVLIEELNADLPPLTNFILPGGSESVARCHLVRTLARRAERDLLTLAEDDAAVNPHSRRYLNRLSDLGFVAARWLARSSGEPEVLWQQDKRP